MNSRQTDATQPMVQEEINELVKELDDDGVSHTSVTVEVEQSYACSEFENADTEATLRQVTQDAGGWESSSPHPDPAEDLDDVLDKPTTMMPVFKIQEGKSVGIGIRRDLWLRIRSLLSVMGVVLLAAMGLLVGVNMFRGGIPSEHLDGDRVTTTRLDVSVQRAPGLDGEKRRAKSARGLAGVTAPNQAFSKKGRSFQDEQREDEEPEEFTEYH